MARLVELILTWERRGTGTQDDPVRIIAQLFTKNGRLVAEYDPLGAKGIATDILDLLGMTA